ncbi:MAG: 3-deoxy-D-manno-octulosonic acid transferase [Pseudobdellovibrionaceae bacterium]
MLLSTYNRLLGSSGWLLKRYLQRRLARGKEDEARLPERMGTPSVARPDGYLIWIHAASVGETQSALILIKALNERLKGKNIHFLVTSVTVTSATLMAQRLPDNAIHQYIPIDHPVWTRAFFDYWKPDIAFCIESELWPNLLKFLRKRHIPSALINGRMSERSYNRWKKVRGTAQEMLGAFDIILTQTELDKDRFLDLGAQMAVVTDNLKYSAKPLPYDEKLLTKLEKQFKKRPVWVYASTHAGEEELALATHNALKDKLDGLFTIIVPRHPERREEIKANLKAKDNPAIAFRSDEAMPPKNCSFYVADTLGELGLFYALSDIALIGRTFSNDGGGGHNPMEGALLKCACLSGPNYQNQTQLTEDMLASGGIQIVGTKDDLPATLHYLFEDDAARDALVEAGLSFAKAKAGVIDHVLDELEPLFLKTDMAYTS